MNPGPTGPLWDSIKQVPSMHCWTVHREHYRSELLYLVMNSEDEMSTSYLAWLEPTLHKITQFYFKSESSLIETVNLLHNYHQLLGWNLRTVPLSHQPRVRVHKDHDQLLARLPEQGDLDLLLHGMVGFVKAKVEIAWTVGLLIDSSEIISDY